MDERQLEEVLDNYYDEILKFVYHLTKKDEALCLDEVMYEFFSIFYRVD